MNPVLLNASDLVNTHENLNKPHCQILDCLSYFSVDDNVGLASVNFMQLATILCEITRNDGHWAVQGHSRSPTLVLITTPYATSYLAPFSSYLGVLVKLSLLTVGAPI